MWGPEDNCRFAKYTLWEMNEYRGYKPDIIHWNNDIWDLFRKDFLDDVFTPKEEYLKYIGMVMNEFKKMAGTIVWASTTPAREGCPFLKNHEIDEYNAAAAELMNKNGVMVNDLNALLRGDVDNLTRPDGFHLSEKGVEMCAEKIAEVLAPLAKE